LFLGFENKVSITQFSNVFEFSVAIEITYFIVQHEGPSLNHFGEIPGMRMVEKSFSSSNNLFMMHAEVP
jgi:hypothetical protein